MWDTRVLNGTLAKKLEDQNITVYAHTVNKWDEVQRLKAKGAFGVYTDWLSTSPASR
jgi:glycerophosphoryl diester phosphodiesterase